MELEKLKKKNRSKISGDQARPEKSIIDSESTFENIELMEMMRTLTAWFEKQFGKYGPDIKRDLRTRKCFKKEH